MASSSAVPARSISLPTRFDPLPLEAEIGKLKAWMASSSPTASSMSLGIQGLVNLYSSVEELLGLPLNQKTITRLHSDKCVDQVLDGYVKLLDACSNIRDTILMIKEQVQNVRSTLRRRGADVAITGEIQAYIRSRRTMEKSVKKILKGLKIMEDKDTRQLNLLLKNLGFSIIVKVLTFVRIVSILVFRSLFSSLLMRKSRSTKHTSWSLVSRALNLKGSSVSHEAGEQRGEFDDVDRSIFSLYNNLLNKDVKVEAVQLAQRRLGTLENCIDGLEAGVELIYRRMIQNRLSLLNTLSL